MEKKYYFSIQVTEEQIKRANELVDFSLKYHPVSNIWDAQKKNKTKQLRTTGTLGEIIFADLYKLRRPIKSFGAIDGQDYGQDFKLKLNKNISSFDIKTMHRNSNIFYENYVLNIPFRNVARPDSITDFFYCISLHQIKDKTIASIIGYLNKKDILDKKIGILYAKGTKRIRRNNTYFTFFEDTYEVFFKNIKNPLITEEIKKREDLKILYLKK